MRMMVTYATQMIEDDGNKMYCIPLSFARCRNYFLCMSSVLCEHVLIHKCNRQDSPQKFDDKTRNPEGERKTERIRDKQTQNDFAL